MDNREREEIVNSLWPVDQERWLKVKYLDQEKVIKAFWMKMDNSKENLEEAKRKGYQITAIGVRDEYTPQISALMDLKADLIGMLYGEANNYIVEMINEKFKAKIDELKAHTIKTDLS